MNNYPNPFNDNTRIRYQLPHPAHVILQIYDIRGAVVETLVNSFSNAGCHEVAYDAGHLASGVYFCSVETKQRRDVNKMLLVK